MARAGNTVTLDFYVSLGLCDTLGNVSGRVPWLFSTKIMQEGVSVLAASCAPVFVNGPGLIAVCFLEAVALWQIALQSCMSYLWCEPGPAAP